MKTLQRLLFPVTTASLIVLFTLSTLNAVPHISGKYRGPRDAVRSQEKNLSINRKKQENSVFSSSAYALQPASGTKEIAVILVNFNGAGSSTSGGYEMVESSYTADITGFQTTFNYLKSFYSRASYGALKLSITYFYASGHSQSLNGSETPYRLQNTMSYYGTGDEDGNGNGLVNLIKDSINTAANGDQVFATTLYDAVLVGHAGYGNETTYHNGDIWSAMVEWNTPVHGYTDGATFPAREWSPPDLPKTSPIGVTCHEFGHMLGLPDLYETKNQGSIVGVWDLMDYGSWGVTGRGYDPVPPSAWCRKLLGWLEPKEITDDVSISDVYSVEASSESVYQLPILGSDTEYFLVCNSTNPPADQVDGLQIWHVDEGVIDGRSFQNRLYSNTVNNYSHATVTLVSADYTIPYNKYFSPKNLWPGIKTIFSIPYSNSYQGISSGITISGIVCNNGKASFDVKYIKMAPLVKLKKLINYPNPAGTAAIINNQNVLTKILLNMDRVPLELELVIYNIAGEKVRVADYRDLKLRTDITNDYNIYFEYAWDGKNDSNQDVAPGVYFYKVVADNTIGTGKMALIR